MMLKIPRRREKWKEKISSRLDVVILMRSKLWEDFSSVYDIEDKEGDSKIRMSLQSSPQE